MSARAARRAHLLSASLDRMGKENDLSTCAVIASLKYAAPPLALALTPSGSHLVVGHPELTRYGDRFLGVLLIEK
ncbi:hypothetical protein AB1Y20_014441 [Prymnesium parvum]|uniref:Uncharacterized protein n=1 Tax=Prymnesium parvum TaxID=97485 RepID=A0AB34IE08_PRYPA